MPFMLRISAWRQGRLALVWLYIVWALGFQVVPSALAAATYGTTPTRATVGLAGVDAPLQSPLGWAQRLIQHLQLSHTGYRHTNTRVTWAGVNGATETTSYTDCSGLLNALLAQTYGLTSDDFDAWLQTRRPLAKHYFAAIRAQNGFSRIRRMANVKPNDIIAIRYLNNVPGDNTGHIMLVAGMPQARLASAPLVLGTSQWDVPVIDSSRSGHGLTDTRRLSDGRFQDGAGQGVLRLYVDGQGIIVGYTWSGSASSLYYDQTTRPLVVGRLNW